MKNTVQIILIRHAQSEWNRQNRFTGWANPGLTEHGVAEASRAAELLHEQGWIFDIAFSSKLQRAQHTLDILLDKLKQNQITKLYDWRLNERHYGVLQGFDKSEACNIYGTAQVHQWRRSYLDKPDSLALNDPAHPIFDPQYQDVDPSLLPGGENLASTRSRVKAFWRDQIVPLIKTNQRILVSAHGNTLRALIMELSAMSVNEVESFEIPTATPIVYCFDENANPLHWQYLQNQESKIA